MVRPRRDMTGPLVSIVLPVHQQAAHIQRIVEAYESALQRLPVSYELILVVNGSTDGTTAACREIAGQRSTVRTYDIPQAGWGRAIRLGLTQARGDVLCYTNSARTTPEDLARMVHYGIEEGHVVVKANRKLRDSWRRRVGSLLFALECRALFDLATWDVNGTPKVFPRQFAHLLKLTRDDDLIDAEFSAVCRRHDYPMIEVPIFSTRRHAGRSTTTWRSALRLFWGAVTLRRSMGRSHR